MFAHCSCVLWSFNIQMTIFNQFFHLSSTFVNGNGLGCLVTAREASFYFSSLFKSHPFNSFGLLVSSSPSWILSPAFYHLVLACTNPLLSTTVFSKALTTPLATLLALVALLLSPFGFLKPCSSISLTLCLWAFWDSTSPVFCILTLWYGFSSSSGDWFYNLYLMVQFLLLKWVFLSSHALSISVTLSLSISLSMEVGTPKWGFY